MRHQIRTHEPIDAVYTWVNGDDSKLQATLRLFRQGPIDGHSVGVRRFRDNGELRHSLRSLEQYAPWIRNVFIVHTGVVPAWLDTTNTGLRTVCHEDIFPDPSILPVFNSWAIELNLHRISGLSRYFLYLNDDFFLARGTPLEWFLPSDGLPRFFFETNAILLQGDSRNVTDRALAHTLSYQPWKGSHHSPALASTRTGWRRYLGLEPFRNKTAHVPQLYNRDVIRDLEARFPKDFQTTRSHRFRAPDDLALNTLYAYYGLANKQIEAVRLDWESQDFLFVGLKDDPERNRGALERLERDRPRCVCVNDDVGSEAPDPPSLHIWKKVMARCWPRPSRFERSCPI